jgi:hypothetical protein
MPARRRLHLLLALAEFVHELLHAFGVAELFLARGIRPLIGERDGDAGIQERQLPQAGAEAVKDERRGRGENGRVREECDLGACVLGIVEIAQHFQRLRGDPTLEADGVDLAIAIDLAFEPVRERVHALCAHTVQAAGELVCAISELAARVQVREHQFHRGHALRVHLHGYATTVVLHADGAIRVNRDPYIPAEAREMLIDGIVHHLEDAMVQAALIGLADIHAWPHADGPEPLKVLNLTGAVFLVLSDSRIEGCV